MMHTEESAFSQSLNMRPQIIGMIRKGQRTWSLERLFSLLLLTTSALASSWEQSLRSDSKDLLIPFMRTQLISCRLPKAGGAL